MDWPHKLTSRPPVITGRARSTASLRRHAANYYRDLRLLGKTPYGVRSAVTNRACRITVLVPAARRQEASKFGHAFSEQSRPTCLMSRRSPLASATGTLASTCGANPGRTVSAAAMNAATATAESALIMTVPCHWAVRPRRLVNGLVTKPGFRTSSRKRKMVSLHPGFVSSPAPGRNSRFAQETLRPNWLIGRPEIAPRGEHEVRGLPGRPGRVRGVRMSRIALYPGSFDPVTNGHLDVVRHAVTLCDRLIVSIGVNSSKKPLFSTEERLAMVRAVFAPVAQKVGCAFDCTTYDKLTAPAAQKAGPTIIIRGLRDGTDLDFEMQIAGMNETMAPDVHTVFAPASAAVPPITATLVRQIAGMGGDVSAFVPPAVAKSLKTKFR